MEQENFEVTSRRRAKSTSTALTALYTLMFLALFCSGCSNNNSNTPVDAGTGDTDTDTGTGIDWGDTTPATTEPVSAACGPPSPRSSMQVLMGPPSLDEAS